MKSSWLLILIMLILAIGNAGNSPYPIIFVHGLASDNYTAWNSIIDSLSFHLGDYYSGDHNFQAVLNAYDDQTSLAGPDGILGTYDDDVQVWFNNENNILDEGNLFTINFKNAWDGWDEDVTYPTLSPYSSVSPGGFWDQNESDSNEASIYKQGYALKKCIEAVLQATGAEKVILIGHSMGGLAIREYLQRTNSGTPNAPHTWWIAPNDITNGHKVARVVTINTPHLGSNSSVFGAINRDRDPLWELAPNENSEAVRDLRISHNSVGVVLDGVYLFGGVETIPALSYFNMDINCDGDESDIVTGLNYATIANPMMPLPENITYTWVTSDCGEGDNAYMHTDYTPGDGVVFLNRQYLYSGNGLAYPPALADTLLTHYLHTDMPLITHPGVLNFPDVCIRGMDEPDSPDFAYELPSNDNKWYSGFITYQPNMINDDVDYYKVGVPSPARISIRLFPNNTGLNNLSILDQNHNYLHAPYVITEGENEIEIVVSNTDCVYLRMEGQAFGNGSTGMQSSYNMYDFIICTSPLSISAQFHATPRAGTIQTSFSFIDDSSVEYFTINEWQWDFNNDSVIDSNEQNPTWSYSAPGVYDVSLRVSDGVHNDTETKVNYIIVNGIPSGGDTEIVWMEYFIDTDPGISNANPLFLMPAPDITLQRSIYIGDLSEGLHRLYVRALDSAGKWGLPQCKPFIVQQTSPQQPLPDLTEMEYFIDTGVIPGGGTNLSLAPSDNVTANTIVTLNNLNDGLHRLYVRAKDEHERWGIPQCKPFIVQQTSPQQLFPMVTQLEYFYDTDPGMGQGNPINVTPSLPDVTVNASLPVNQLTLGNHMLYVRAKDSLERWGLPQSMGFQLVIRPDTPQNAAIKAINGSLVISWDTVQQIDGYKVYASDNANSGFEDITNLGSITTASNRVSWTMSIMAATHKFYYVKSFRSDATRDERISKEEVDNPRMSSGK